MELLSQFLIERPEWFVHEEHRWAVNEHTSDRNSLLLATRKLLGVTAAVPWQPHHLESLVDQRTSLRQRHSPNLERKCDVLSHAHVWEK